MAIQLNHTIVNSKDKRESAEFVADILGVRVGTPMGPFIPVQLDNNVTLDFGDSRSPVSQIQSQHYAFLVTDEVFDAAFEKIKRYGISYWADPRGEIEGDINHNDGGRGFYFQDPSGHYLELITVPYGG